MAQSKMSVGKEQCFICFNDFIRSTHLPTPHSCLKHFCDKCLKDCCNNNSEEVQKLCPMCSYLFRIPKEIRLMCKDDDECVAKDHVSNINRKRKAEQPKCELCENVNAKAFCIQCIQSFCQKCSNVHSKLSSTSFHKVVDIQERPSKVELQKMKSNCCTKHNGQEIVLYCCDCKQLLCFACRDAAHNSHKCISSVDAVTERREAVMKYQKSIEKCRKFETGKEKNLQDLLVKYNEQVVQAEKSTEELFDNLAKLLQERKADILKHLKELKDRQEQNIGSKLKKSNLQKAELNRLLSDCRMTMIKSTDFELVKVSDELHKRANQLINQQNENNKQAVPEISLKFDQPPDEIINDMSKTLMEIDVDDYQKIPDYMEKFFRGASCMATKREAYVKGLTVVDDLMYELSDNGISVCDKKTFAIKSMIRIPGMKSPVALAGCSLNKALYVSDKELNCIHRVNLIDNKVNRWKVKDNFNIHGLSVTSKHNLLVTARLRFTRSDSKILEYSSEGKLIREIQLDDDTKYAHHTIESSDGLFIVCHGYCASRSGGLRVINAEGDSVYRYGEPYEEGEHPLSNPCAIAVDSDNSGIIFVADSSSNMIVMFNRHLTFLGTVEVKASNSFSQPSQIYFDCSTDRLHVSLRDDYSRVVIISPDCNENEFKTRCNQIDPIAFGYD